MTNMAQIEVAMFESVTTKTKSLTSIVGKQTRPRRECRSKKRSYDLESSSLKRPKLESLDADELNDNQCAFHLNSESDEENDTESKCSTSDDTEPLLVPVRQIDDNSDIEEIEDETSYLPFAKITSDQQRFVPVIVNETVLQQQQALSRHSKRLIGQFKYLYSHGIRKFVQPTLCPDELFISNKDFAKETHRWELRNAFNRIDLFKQGYSVLSNEPFPFYSLCYLCGSLGDDLIYCNSCCEAYHRFCLNDNERPRLDPPTDSWLCPKCNVCSICGLLTYSHSDANSSPQMLSCTDCQRNFHFKCLKRFKDDQWNELVQQFQSTPTSVIIQSRLSNCFFLNQSWLCPSCIRCDCGQEIPANERNIVSFSKNILSQQLTMCHDCLNNFKFLRLHKNDQIERCHFCEKYLEQISIKSQKQVLFQCSKCQLRFHPKCDGFLNEDPLLLSEMKKSNIVCSKCDVEQRNQIQICLVDSKIETMKIVQSDVASILKRISTIDEDLPEKLHWSVNQLEKLHESRQRSLNLHGFLLDLINIIRTSLPTNEINRWQSAIDGSILRQCPWFKSSLVNANASNQIASNPPLTDHEYISHTKTFSSIDLHRKKNRYSLQSDSLLHLVDERKYEDVQTFENFHEKDQRKCQLCETNSDRTSSNINRLITIGLNQWVHVGCILPAYAKNLDQPPYILRNIRETILRCQSKYMCALCSKLGASVHCFENECYQRFHCECIQKYYNNVDAQIRQQLNIKNGFLPNLTTYCLRHNGLRSANKTHRDSAEVTNDDQTKESMSTNAQQTTKMKSVRVSSTVYGDLSNVFLDFSLDKIHLCIGSLQIHSLGNFDYLIDPPKNSLSINENYPDGYQASRLFWSLENPKRKTVYHLKIDVEQNYHQDQSQHVTTSFPMTDEERIREQIYQTCREYFEKYQKKIDEHSARIEEFCQRTMVQKKGKANENCSNATTTATGRKRTNQTGSVGTTKRLTKSIPSCVKRQTAKAAFKNVSRPRNRFANDKQNKQSTNLPVTAPAPAAPANKENLLAPKDFAISDLQSLFNSGIFKTNNVSHFALALAQALTQVVPGPSGSAASPFPAPAPPLPPPTTNSNLNVPNGSTFERTNDQILKQLLRSASAPHSISETSSDHRSQTKLRENSFESSNVVVKEKHFLPQFDGCFENDDEIEECRSTLNSLIDRICSNDQKRNQEQIEFLIKRFQIWSKSVFGRVRFTITNDEGFSLISEDLDAAWTSIVEKIRSNRDDRNFAHLSMNDEQLNGHQIFGLNKSTVQTMLNQIYSNVFNEQNEINSSIALPLTLTSTLFPNNKISKYSPTRAKVHKRKHRERQRFGWLLSQRRKIQYALKTFEIDDALLHSRKILLEEASVSLRLYHLHYFSQRALLVGSSPIHGCGLFTLIDLVEGQMIVEYTGEVVRPCLTDKRERENEVKGFGCYMFTVDSMHVIDATHRGNKARFINHNCSPNCFAKTVLSGGVKHIVIYALTDIARGSELTYDYSFPEEDIKIPCHCGTSQCRIYLN